MAEQEPFTNEEIQELLRIEKRFEDVGDIRLSLMHREAVRWTGRWNKAKNLGIGLAIGGEALHLVGKSVKSDGLETIGRGIRNFGVASTAISWLGASFSDFHAQDAQVELLMRRENRR